MEFDILREQKDDVARDGIITAYVNGERLIIKTASNFFGLDRGSQDQVTADGLGKLVAGVDDGRLSAFDAFSSVLDGRPGLRMSIEIEALGKLCGMYVERLHDEESSPEFVIFAKGRIARFRKRVHDLTEV